VRRRAADIDYPCVCCGYLTMGEPPGRYGICDICFWEDDAIQLRYPFVGGANHVSLIEAQQNFIEFGACERRSIKHVRAPKRNERRDPAWRPIDLDRDGFDEFGSTPGKKFGLSYFEAFANEPKDGTALYWWLPGYRGPAPVSAALRAARFRERALAIEIPELVKGATTVESIEHALARWAIERDKRQMLGDSIETIRMLDHEAAFPLGDGAATAAASLRARGFTVSTDDSVSLTELVASRAGKLSDASVSTLLTEVIAIIEANGGTYKGFTGEMVK